MISTAGIEAVARELSRGRREYVRVDVCNDDAWRIWVRTKDGVAFSHIGGDEVERLMGDAEATVDLIAKRIDAAREQIRPWARWPYSVRIGRRRAA